MIDPVTRKNFSDTLKAQATKTEPLIQALKSNLLKQNTMITATQYTERVNTILASDLQVNAEKIQDCNSR